MTLDPKTLYNPFNKTIPKPSLQIHWISLRFYEMGVTINIRICPEKKAVQLLLAKRC